MVRPFNREVQLTNQKKSLQGISIITHNFDMSILLFCR